EPAPAGADDLVWRVRLVAAAALLVRYWPAEGARHHAALALAGMLERAGWELEQGKTFLVAGATGAEDKEFKDRLRGAASTAQRIAAGNPATGAPTLAQIVGDEVVDRVREWLRLTSLGTADSGSWPDPAPFGDELLPVPPFDLELIPS